jgi:hypothetical protein
MTENDFDKLAASMQKDVKAVRGVKLSNKKEQQLESKKKEKEEYLKKFDQKADRTVEIHNKKTQSIIDSVSKFMKVVADKTLPQNKGIIGEEVESEIRQKLMELALEMNNDENEEDYGKGSIIVLTVLLKVILNYRDRINALEYNLDLLKKESNGSR